MYRPLKIVSKAWFIPMILFSIVSALYYWVYSTKGFEATMISIGVMIIFLQMRGLHNGNKTN